MGNIRKKQYFFAMDMMFKKTLRSELDFKNKTVKELAAETGISQRTLEGYLSSRGSIPPADVAVKIARTLQVTVEYLVTGTVEEHYFSGSLMENELRIKKELLNMSPIEKKFLVRMCTVIKELFSTN